MTDDLRSGSSQPDKNVIVFDTPTGPVSHSHRELFDILNARLDHIEQGQKEIRETMIRTEELVQKFIAAAGPAVDSVIPMITNLAENPMVKMMLRGKKTT